MRLGSRRYKALQIPIQNDILMFTGVSEWILHFFHFKMNMLKQKSAKKKQENQTIITNKYE